MDLQLNYIDTYLLILALERHSRWWTLAGGGSCIHGNAQGHEGIVLLVALMPKIDCRSAVGIGV